MLMASVGFLVTCIAKEGVSIVVIGTPSFAE